MQIQVKISDKSIKELQDMVPDFKSAFYTGMKKAMYHTEGQIKKSFGYGNKPKVGTGHLRRSIQSGVQKKGNDIQGYVGSNVKYAAIHEFGGVIKPKTGEYLYFMLDGQFKKVKQVVIPERSYLREGVEENINNIKDILLKEITEGLNK
jgi:phage gpG-like protein